MEKKYYTLDEIFEKKDINGEKPSTYIITTNRSAGKTTAVLDYCLTNWYNTYDEEKKYGEEFVLIYRTVAECKDSGLEFSDILFRNPKYGSKITHKQIADGIITQVFLDDKRLCYAVSLKKADNIKKYSHIFMHVRRAIFDEYQLESGEYLKDETTKLSSVLMSVSRGGGEQSRKIELFLLGNPVSNLNPYYLKYGINRRLRPETRFLRGDGWVGEFGFNESAATAIESNTIYNVIGGQYLKSTTKKGEYMIPGVAFVEKPKGNSRYCFTILHDGEYVGIRIFQNGYVWCTSKIEKTCKDIFSLNVNEYDENISLLNSRSYEYIFLKKAFETGVLRFDCFDTKNIIYDILAINLYN